MSDDDPRLQTYWQQISLVEALAKKEKDRVAVLSYPDDEGVRNNGGRPGAAQGPDRLLHYLGRLVFHSSCPAIYIISDRPKSLQLSERHEEAGRMLEALLRSGFRVISLGGGHDYGYPDADAYYKVKPSKIVNIDAHLDVRPVAENKLGSGTPFRRWLEKNPGKDLIQWGIQLQCNAQSHIDWAKSHNVKILSYRDAWPRVKSSLGMSICLDAFQGIRGVSAPAMVGIDCREGLEFVRAHSAQSSWMGIYECAPSRDPETEDSARFGALLAYHFIYRGQLHESDLF